MRNSVTPSPVASSTPFESFYDSLSNREKDQFDQDEREQVIRQMGMAEIDNGIDWPEEMMELPDEVSDDDIFDVSSDEISAEDRDYQNEGNIPSFDYRMNALQRKRNRPPRHILRKGNRAE